jgi:hypothetical protein
MAGTSPFEETNISIMRLAWKIHEHRELKRRDHD